MSNGISFNVSYSDANNYMIRKSNCDSVKAEPTSSSHVKELEGDSLDKMLQILLKSTRELDSNLVTAGKKQADLNIWSKLDLGEGNRDLLKTMEQEILLGKLFNFKINSSNVRQSLSELNNLISKACMLNMKLSDKMACTMMLNSLPRDMEHVAFEYSELMNTDRNINKLRGLITNASMRMSVAHRGTSPERMRERAIKFARRDEPAVRSSSRVPCIDMTEEGASKVKTSSPNSSFHKDNN